MQATKIPAANGRYQDTAGNRFTVRCCATIALPAGSPLIVSTVDNLAEFLAAQGLTAVPPTPLQTFAAAVAAGYTVPGVTPALVLDLSDAAQARFTSLRVLLDIQLAGGRIAATDAVTITDLNGQPRAFSVANVQTMILGYGEYFAGLFAALHAAPAAS